MTQDLQDIHNQASDAMADGDKEKAIELYNEILTIAPTDEIALGQLMDLYFETDKFQYYLMRANYNVVNQKFEHAINEYRSTYDNEELKAKYVYDVGIKSNIIKEAPESFEIEFCDENLLAYFVAQHLNRTYQE